MCDCISQSENALSHTSFLSDANKQNQGREPSTVFSHYVQLT